MNRIRTSIVTAALVGGSIVGVAGASSIVDAATGTGTGTGTDTVDPATAEPGSLDAERVERREARRAARAADRQEVADLLGVTVEELAEQLRDGSTLEDVAEANGVEVAAVVDLIVQQRTERIDEAVANERMTAEVAEELKADLEERVTTRVEEGRPERGDGEGRRGGRGPGHGGVNGPAQDGGEDAPAPVDTVDPEG